MPWGGWFGTGCVRLAQGSPGRSSQGPPRGPPATKTLLPSPNPAALELKLDAAEVGIQDLHFVLNLKTKVLKMSASCGHIQPFKTRVYLSNSQPSET